MGRRIRGQIAEWQRGAVIATVAIEEPLDATMQWRGYGKQQRGTAFRLGAYYQLAVTAAGELDIEPNQVASYPVTNHGKRRGWMRGRKRDVVMVEALAWLKAAGAPVHDLSEHETMASGVLLYHLTERAGASLAEKLDRARRTHARHTETTR